MEIFKLIGKYRLSAPGFGCYFYGVRMMKEGYVCWLTDKDDKGLIGLSGDTMNDFLEEWERRK